MSNKKDEQLVRYFKQSNSIIEARYKLKYVEKCVFSKAYMMVEEKDLTDPHKTYRIYIKDLIRDFGLSNDGLTYQKVRDWARELRKKELTFPYVDENGNMKTIYSGFFTSVIASNEVEDTTRDAYIEIEFDRRLKPYLLAAKKYTLFNQKRYEFICSKLHNATIIRLYEILKQYYRFNAERSEKWFNIQELKEILGVVENYRLYGSFKQKVLVLAQERFAQFADISFDYIEKKQGKAVTEIKFSIRPTIPTDAPDWLKDEVEREMQAHKEQRTRSNVEKTPPENAIVISSVMPKEEMFQKLLPKAKSIGISEAVLRLVIDTHDAEAVRNGLEYTIFEAQKGKIKESIEGYFISAVKRKYTNVAFEQEKKKRVGEGQSRAKSFKKEEIKVEIERLQDDIYEKQNDIIRELVVRDPSVTANAITKALQMVQKTARLANYVKKKDWILENLTLEEWRKDAILRGCVIEAIVEQNKESFALLEPQYKKMEALQISLKTLS